MRLKILIPDNFREERQYIIDVILGDFLGLDYESAFHMSDETIIKTSKNKEVIFKDHFWNKFTEENNYLKKSDLPSKIMWITNRFIPEENLPVIFGDSRLEVEDNRIICGIDVFASAFFMLTRWEEYVIEDRDRHLRFPDNMSFAQKNNFHYRPVVNEYVEMIWNMLKFLGCEQKRKLRSFKIIPTHDVDFFLKFGTFKDFFKTFGGDLLKRKNLRLAKKTIGDYLKFISKKTNDPYDTFNYLMDLSDQNNLQSHFYFIAGKKGETDVRYDFLTEKVEKTLKNIMRRGHIVGIHGSYDSYNDNEIFEREIKRFKEFNIEVKEGRQHFLRFEVPKTWQIWNDNNMRYDSTIGYSNDIGFRAGVCYPYPVFDILSRKKLNLIERPLIAMEVAARNKYQYKNEMLNALRVMKNTVRKYNGEFVLLWHNSNFNNYLWYDYKEIYEKTLNNA